MNTEEKYFQYLANISEKVHIFIDNEIKKVQENTTPEVFSKIEMLHEKRKESNIFRAFLTNVFYDFFKQNNIEDEKLVISICSLSELNNYNAYLDNWILDNKNNVWNGDNARENIGHITIASGIYREIIERVLLKIPISDSKKILISSFLSEAMNHSYRGQAIDMSMGIETISNFKTENEYLDAYTEKSLLQSGYLYGASCKIGAIISDATQEMIDISDEIGRLIGTGLHISNDLGDFALMDKGGDFKTYQDQCADLRNGRLTLPIWYVLTYGSESEKDFFLNAVGKIMTREQHIAIIKALHDSGAYGYCKKLIRKYYNQSKKLIKTLPESKHKELLQYAPVVIRNNKYLANLKM